MSIKGYNQFILGCGGKQQILGSKNGATDSIKATDSTEEKTTTIYDNKREWADKSLLAIQNLKDKKIIEKLKFPTLLSTYLNSINLPQDKKESLEAIFKTNYANQEPLLDLKGFGLPSLPDFICTFPWLKELYAEDNNLSSLPPDIGNLHLTALLLSNNKLTTLPTSFSKLTELGERDSYLPGLNERKASLCLDNNLFEEVPEELKNLTELKILRLEHNKIKSLPDWLGNLSKLKIVNLSYNEITELEKGCQSILSSQLNSEVLELNLGYNQLAILPSNFVVFEKNLSKLDLSGNQFESLPPALQSFVEMNDLILGNNLLTGLPRWLNNLSKLKILYLSKNKLITIPENTINKLSQLEQLFLDGNKLFTIPNDIGTLSSLRGLYVQNNPDLDKLPPSLKNILNLRSVNTRHTGIPEEQLNAILQDRE